MEKNEHIDLLKNDELNCSIIEFEDLQQNCLKYQNSLESNIRLGSHFLDSNNIEDKTMNQNIQVDSYEKFQMNKNINSNSASSGEIQVIQKQKTISDLTLQKITTSLMLSQIPKINFNKNLEPKFMNSFINYSTQHYQQINDNQNNSKKKEIKQDIQENSSRHKKFTEEEDEMLKRIVFTFGAKNWRLIASLMPGRTPRQCRDRYSNYLAPGFIHSEWSKEEDKLLAEKYAEIGPKWTQLRQYFPFRTANDIKNRYNYTVSRKIDLIKSGREIINEYFKANEMQYQNRQSFSHENETEKNEIKKLQNDVCTNEDIIELKSESFYFENDDFQTNEFDFIFINE